MLACRARRLSPHTIEDYERTLNKFSKFLNNDPPIQDITLQHIEQFLSSNPKLSNKSILNSYIGLSSMWTWLVKEEIAKDNLVRKLKAPKPQKTEITPLNEDELKAILGALGKSKIYVIRGKPVNHSLGNMERNRAIILLMLDTGVRASELCDLKIEDLDNRNNRIFVRQGKGMKERLLPFSPRTGQMIWRYLASRKETRPSDPLFASRDNGPIDRRKLAEMFSVIGQRAGVKGFHPHRLRHTFAIMYLRNGGNAYTLQTMLGHSSMEMVRHYLQLAQIDLDTAHKRASPVENWRL